MELRGEAGAFELQLKGGDAPRATHVIVAIGLQGNLRRFGVPGDDLPHVTYHLDDDIPEWGTFTPDGSTVTVAVDGGDRYGFAFGRFVGTGPESGTEWDFETVVPTAPGGPAVSGSASALDVWLWGRGEDGVRAEDPTLMARLREAAARATG